MHVLVLGGYGLIGEGVCRALAAAGHRVTGLGRSAEKGRAALPGLRWIAADIGDLARPSDWVPHLEGIDAVVNAAGALQDSGRDDLAAVQTTAILALIAACEQADTRDFVQISAPGADAGAPTAFLATKGRADDALRSSALRWTVLKPGLVIAPTAHGGTGLLRALAAFPVVQPVFLPGTAVQCVDLRDVAEAVVAVLARPDLARRDYDLVEPEPGRLGDVVLEFRRWLGFPAPRAVWPIPVWAGRLAGRAADMAGHFGWRAPLRSTAIRVLEDGVRGDPGPWRTATGAPLASLRETLTRMPATRQERQFARTHLIFPLIVVVLAGFWLVSGVIGFISFDAAVAVIADTFPRPVAMGLVAAGSALDIAVGVLIARRASFVRGCAASVALALGYLGTGTLTDPGLWADPLGPYVKVLPAICLGLAGMAMGSER